MVNFSTNEIKEQLLEFFLHEKGYEFLISDWSILTSKEKQLVKTLRREDFQSKLPESMDVRQLQSVSLKLTSSRTKSLYNSWKVSLQMSKRGLMAKNYNVHSHASIAHTLVIKAEQYFRFLDQSGEEKATVSFMEPPLILNEVSPLRSRLLHDSSVKIEAFIVNEDIPI